MTFTQWRAKRKQAARERYNRQIWAGLNAVPMDDQQRQAEHQRLLNTELQQSRGMWGGLFGSRDIWDRINGR